MDTLCAIAAAEDSDDFNDDYEEEYDPKNVNPEEEAIEEIENDENDQNFTNMNDKFSFYFTPEFVLKAAKDYEDRIKELEKRNLPYWNV